MMTEWNSKFFYGNEISKHGQEQGFLDYATLAKAFDAVLNNEILSETEGVCGYWDLVSGFPTDDEEEEEIYQFYIVSSAGAEILEELNEIVYYNETLDMYLWGVTHYGTAWDYVLTPVKLNIERQ